MAIMCRRSARFALVGGWCRMLFVEDTTPEGVGCVMVLASLKQRIQRSPCFAVQMMCVFCAFLLPGICRPSIATMFDFQLEVWGTPSWKACWQSNCFVLTIPKPHVFNSRPTTQTPTPPSTPPWHTHDPSPLPLPHKPPPHFHPHNPTMSSNGCMVRRAQSMTRTKSRTCW